VSIAPSSVHRYHHRGVFVSNIMPVLPDMDICAALLTVEIPLELSAWLINHYVGTIAQIP
jgi:hypothetical protein